MSVEDNIRAVLEFTDKTPNEQKQKLEKFDFGVSGCKKFAKIREIDFREENVVVPK